MARPDPDLNRRKAYICGMSEETFKSGFVGIIGKPNAGKSTLMNALVGRKLAITTPKAQTTRHRILGIAQGEDYQIVFSDTPGVILPKYRLHKAMMRSVNMAVEDADVILLLVDINEKFPEEELFKRLQKADVPILLVLNKIDQSTPEKARERKEAIEAQVKIAGAIGISALHGANLLELRDLILEHLPEGPPYFDPEMLSDRPERFFVAEMIREKVFLFLREEIPYSVEVSIAAFEEGEKFDTIHADIHVERSSQKGIVIGKKGEMLKKIGTAARKDIEEFLNKQVMLKLFVKVTDDWKDSGLRLKDFGYEE